MNEQAFLNRLKTAQSDLALQALRQPNLRDAFEYGQRVGMVAGLEHAIALLLNQLSEERDDNIDL